jgi:hypothetical protein
VDSVEVVHILFVDGLPSIEPLGDVNVVVDARKAFLLILGYAREGRAGDRGVVLLAEATSVGCGVLSRDLVLILEISLDGVTLVWLCIGKFILIRHD